MSAQSITVTAGQPGVPPRSLLGPNRAALDAVLEVYEGAYRLGRAELENAVVIDVGANIGAFALLALDHGAAAVLAVEPDPTSCLYLQGNLERAGYEAQVELIAQPAGDPRLPRALAAGAGVHRTTERASGSCPVPTVGLDELVDRALQQFGNHPPGSVILKADCEGAEYDLIGAASDQALDALSWVSMEWHGAIAVGQPSAVGRIGALVERLLDSHSVTLFGHPGQGGQLYAHHY